uniref:Putative tail protein n=1 Tax=viral metagenome TaxID=1070528 RepID=A0A6M3LZ20_9ZZZZ
MSISIGDAILKVGVDKADFNKSMGDMEKNVQSSMQKVQGGFKVAGAALTAFGVAGLAAVSSARKMNAELGQTALTIGVSTKEMRDLALSVTNVTFPLESVSKTFDILARAGINNTEEMKNAANAFDSLADATGTSAESVADILIPSFKNFGVAMPQTAAELDKFTWLTKNTTVDISNFADAMNYVAKEGADLGVNLDDMVAIMAALEARGVSGTAATMKFRTAITEAAKGETTLIEALGLTNYEIETQNARMQEATGITEKYAEVANTQYGVMDKVKQAFKEITLKAGSLLTPMEPLLGIMTTLGPVMLFMSSSMGMTTVKTIAHTAALIAHNVAMLAARAAMAVATTAQWLFNAAMSANPIGLVIAAVVALVAGGIALWKNWDTVVAFFKDAWEKMKEYALKGVLVILDALSSFMGFIPGLGNAIDSARDKIRSMIDAGKVAEDAGKVVKATKDMQLEIEKLAQQMTESLRKQLEEERDLRFEALKEAKDTAQEEYDARIEALRKEYGELATNESNKMDLARQTTEEKRKQFDIEIGLAESAYEAIKKALEDERDLKLQTIADLKDAAQAEYDNRIALLDQEYGVLETHIDSKMDLARKATEAQKKQYDIELDDALYLYNEKIKLINEEYAYKLSYVDQEAAYRIQAAQDRIDEINGITDAENKAAEEQAQADKLAALQAAIDIATTFEDQTKAVEAFNAYRAELAKKNIQAERNAEKDTLRALMDTIRVRAEGEKARLATELKEREAHETGLYQATVDRLTLEKAALDTALEETLKRINDERLAVEQLETDRLAATTTALDALKVAEETHYTKALADAKTLKNVTVATLEFEKGQLDIALAQELTRLQQERIAKEETETALFNALQKRLDDEEVALTAHYEKQLSDAELHIAAINAATAELKDRVVTITTQTITAPSPEPSAVVIGRGEIWPADKYQHGGVIPEPTLLYGLKSRRPYAIAGEAGTEYVTPAGYKTANIIVQLDSKILARVIGQPLVEEIRVRQGLKL